MNTRLKQFLAAENISQAQFADKINVVRASVSHVLSGRNNPSFDFIKAMMANYPTLNIDWLMFGKGKMYKDKEVQQEEPVHINASDVLLFPDMEETDLGRTPDPVVEIKKEINLESSNSFNTSDNSTQNTVKQRKVSKIIVLFDDGTFQEM